MTVELGFYFVLLLYATIVTGLNNLMLSQKCLFHSDSTVLMGRLSDLMILKLTYSKRHYRSYLNSIDLKKKNVNFKRTLL